MTSLDFGPFEPAFDSSSLPVPGYLCLLAPASPAETLVVIDRIRAGLEEPGRDPTLHALLRDVDWRPHLVAAVALLLIDAPQPFLADLWSAVRAGSWVSPQLLAVASVRDNDFLTIAAAREAERFEVRAPAGLTPLERHSATGPATDPQRSAKEASAILALCELTATGTAWAARVRDEPDLRRLLANDLDSGGEIATRWLTDIRQVLATRGLRGTARR
jgi:hypothetical protein